MMRSKLSSVPYTVTEPAFTSVSPDRGATVGAPDIGIGDDILVVDDDPANLVAIEAALLPLGRTLVYARSGLEALGKLLDQDFALVLLDVAMPGMTGIETARLIRSRERSRGTPIIFVTGMSWQDQAVDEAYEAGGADFLVKPVRAEVLRAKARVFLTLQERTRTLHRQAKELHDSQARLYEHELHEQHKRFESALIDSRTEHLAEADRRQHGLAAIIGNELLNPLQTLQMAFDLLREHPNADMGERIHAMVEHRLIHVTRLVEGLIDVARVAAGRLELSPQTVNLTEILRHALDACRPIIETRKLTVRLEADPSVPPLVIGDPVRLLQAFTTLVDHAARCTPDHGQIVATSRVAAGDVVVWVTDTGRGIAPELLSTIFDVCIDDGAERCGAKFRLGLILVKRLIELHDGTVHASSDGIGKGATFEVRLPLAPQDVELPSPDPAAPPDTEPVPPDLFTRPTLSMTASDLPPGTNPDDDA